MKRSQWSLLFFGALFLACLLHVKFCEWASGARAADLGLESLIGFGADPELTWGLYSNQAELSFTAAFLCGVVLPLGFLAAAAFLLLARPRPRFRPPRSIVEDLQTGDTAARATAAGALASPGTRAAEGAGALSRALRDGTVKVQAEAAEALADIGPEAGEAVGDLVRELTSSDAAVRQTCARALGKIGRRAVASIPGLRDLRNDECEVVQLLAAEAIERIRGECERADTVELTAGR